MASQTTELKSSTLRVRTSTKSADPVSNAFESNSVSKCCAQNTVSVDSSNSSPGPAAYNVNSAKRAVYKSLPRYSFGIRYKDLKIDGGPGPAYSIDGKYPNQKTAPSYSLSSRHQMSKAVPFSFHYE